jgi:hypothetical protein
MEKQKTAWMLYLSQEDKCINTMRRQGSAHRKFDTRQQALEFAYTELGKQEISPVFGKPYKYFAIQEEILDRDIPKKFRGIPRTEYYDDIGKFSDFADEEIITYVFDGISAQNVHQNNRRRALRAMGYKLVDSYESFGESKFFYKKNGEVA